MKKKELLFNVEQIASKNSFFLMLVPGSEPLTLTAQATNQPQSFIINKQTQLNQHNKQLNTTNIVKKQTTLIYNTQTKNKRARVTLVSFIMTLLERHPWFML